MPQVTFSESDIKKSKKVYRDDELRGINSVLKRHVIRLIKIAFTQYNKDPKEWVKFIVILKRIL